MSEKELALNGDAGPVRRPKWRIVEATYGRYVTILFVPQRVQYHNGTVHGHGEWLYRTSHENTFFWPPM
jgi:hypothetical protein